MNATPEEIMRERFEAAVVIRPAGPPAAESAAHQWPAPREIRADLLPVPEFDAEVLLPGPLGAFVLDEADRMSAPPDYVAAALLVALGAVIGARCVVKPKARDSWCIPANLFGGIIGEPSARKTPAASAVLRYIERLEAREAELHAEALKVHAAEMAAHEAQQTAIKATMKKAASGNGDELKMRAAISDLSGLEAPDGPRMRRYRTADATTAKLGALLADNPKGAGILVFRDELAGWLASLDNEMNRGDKAFYLEGYNGTASFPVDRIGRGSIVVSPFCLSVFGGIQPGPLTRYMMGASQSMEQDGFLARFQLLVYPDPKPWKWVDRYPAEGTREFVRDVFDRLAAFDPVQDGATPADDFNPIPAFRFSPEAREVFAEWSADLNLNRIPRESDPLLRQHLGKFDRLFCSLALVLHLAYGRIGDVQEDTAVHAAMWCEHLEGHARRVYSLAEHGRMDVAALLARRIAAGKLADQFTARDVVRKGWSGLSNTAQADTALGILEEFGHVVGIEIEGETGRPTTRYTINPRTLEASA